MINLQNFYWSKIYISCLSNGRQLLFINEIKSNTIINFKVTTPTLKIGDSSNILIDTILMIYNPNIYKSDTDDFLTVQNPKRLKF